MKYSLTSKIEKIAAPVLILKKDDKIENHRFFVLLSEEDRIYLQNFIKNSSKKDGSRVLLLPSGKHSLIFNTGERKKFNWRKSLLAMRQAVSLAKKERIKVIEVDWKDFTSQGGESKEEIFEALATQIELANFEFVVHKTPPPEGWSFLQETFIYADGLPVNTDKLRQILKNGQIIGEEINKARILSNTPGGEMTPAKLAEAAKKAGRQTGFKVKVLNEKEIEKLKMGGVLGVSKGSAEKPRFIVMEYFRGPENEKPVVLVGKGVTFDTGGLNLKPEQAIYEMHMDMSGGAAVIHILAASARLKVKKNIVGLVPAVENMPSGSSYHPGDLLKTMSGKTIEVLNTDAEGRVILADGLTYAQKYKPRLVIDIATLTGAAMSALGQRASAIFTNEEKLEEIFRKTGERVGDYVWPLPLWEEYEEEIKGTFGDVANVGKTRYGGAITGAVFLWQFIKDYPWVHLDIAPRMTTIESEFLAKGAAGASINLLFHFLKGY